MNEFKPFNLVFLLEVLDRSCEERRMLEEVLESVAEQGLLDFLDFPPTIRVEQIPRGGWEPWY